MSDYKDKCDPEIFSVININPIHMGEIIALDPNNIERDDLFIVETFLNRLKVRDLLVFQRMINTAVDYRIANMDRR